MLALGLTNVQGSGSNGKRVMAEKYGTPRKRILRRQRGRESVYVSRLREAHARLALSDFHTSLWIAGGKGPSD
jgi:hypothetical protein